MRRTMVEDLAEMQDPHRNKRLALAIPAAFLLGASGFFSATIPLHADGSHGPVLGMEAARALVLVIAALLIVYFAAQPLKPDPRIAQAVMLAAAIIALVIGLDALIGPHSDPAMAPGIAPYLQIVSTVALLALRWKRSLWPTSRWMIEAKEAAAKRAASRRTK